MALNEKGGFGLDLEETFKNVKAVDSVKPTHTDTHTHDDTHTPTHTHTDDDTHTHTHNDEDVFVKETKTRRVQLLTYSSLVDRIDAYTRKTGMSRVEVYEAAVTEYLDKHKA